MLRWIVDLPTTPAESQDTTVSAAVSESVNRGLRLTPCYAGLHKLTNWVRWGWILHRFQ